MSAAMLSQALLSHTICGELNAGKLHVLRRPLTSLMHFAPQKLQDSGRDASKRRCRGCTATGSSLAAAQTQSPLKASQQQLSTRIEPEWHGLVDWRASGVDARRHWGPRGPEAQVRPL